MTKPGIKQIPWATPIKLVDTTPLVLRGDVFDCLDRMVSDGIKVDTIITSPPYWMQRDYEARGQIGLEKTSDDYVGKIADVSDMLMKVLNDKGTFFLNVGDKYTGKCLELIPQKISIELQKRGWECINVIAWYKPNHMPSPINTRMSSVYEPVYVFIKRDHTKYTPRYYVNIDPIREQLQGETIERETLSIEEYEKMRREDSDDKPYQGKFATTKRNNFGASPGARMSVDKKQWSLQRKHKITEEERTAIILYLKEELKKSGITTRDIDEKVGKKDAAAHWFRLDRGGSLPAPSHWPILKELLYLDDRYDAIMTETYYVSQKIGTHPAGKNPGDLWTISLERTPFAHFATFPVELPSRIIKAFCPEGGIVLDPFGGSGSTGLAAKELGRKSIMIELNSDFVDIMSKRCGKVTLMSKR